MPTPKQLAVVHLAKKHLGMDEELYRSVLKLHGCAESAADLDARGFERVMAYFTACGFRSTWTKRTYGERAGMATPRQVDLIRQMWRQWSGSDDDAALNAWLERSFHVSALRFLPATSVGKAITGLKTMTRRKREAAREGACIQGGVNVIR